MKSFKQILETVYRPKGGDEQAFLDKHVVDLQAHPAATEFQFKGAKTPKAKRKADYDEKEDEKVYEAAEVHTKRADKEPVIVRSTDPKTGESKSKTVMRRAGEIKIGEEVELDEDFKKGDTVKPTKGPHKGVAHEVIHDYGDGHYNIKPKGLNPKQIRYSMGAAKAYKSDLVKEEVELEESITKMSDARLKFHATKNVPHGSYTRKEVEDEHKRRMKTGGVSYASVKPSMNEEADLDEKVKNPYAVGMAAAMKSTGDTPPLKKSTIVKGHEIAKSIQKEAMDPVSKADADINNDGKVDGSDKYLHARRKAIGKALRKEETEELDEISKKTLGSYVTKASYDAAKHAARYGSSSKPGSFVKAHQRLAGIKKASDKLAKEEVEQIDELSPNTLHSYIKKAAGNMAGNAAVAAAQASSSMKKSSPDVKRNIANRMKGITGASGRLADKANMAEEAELAEVSDKKLDAYRQKAFADQPSGDDGSDKYRKRKFGRDLAFAKQTGRAKVIATKEEVEQIDELSKKTLGSYVKKASADQYFKGQDAQYHDNKAKKAEGPFAKETKKKHYALAARANDKASNRDTGISRAVDRLTKEEVELDEAFKIGAMKLKDGSSVTLTRESVDALNGLFNQLNSANKSKMEERMMSGQKGFKEILSFAENI
jgi:hypothetical protein